MSPLPYESIRPGPYIGHPAPPPPAMFFPAADPSLSLPTSIVVQIDYYFRYLYLLSLFIDHILVC